MHTEAVYYQTQVGYIDNVSIKGEDDMLRINKSTPCTPTPQSHLTQRKQQLKTKRSQKKKNNIYKSWLTTTLSSGIVEVLGVIEKISNYLWLFSKKDMAICSAIFSAVCSKSWIGFSDYGSAQNPTDAAGHFI